MAKDSIISVTEGETWRGVVHLRDADGKPLSLSGATIRWLVYRRDDDAILLDASTANGMIAVVDSATALISVTVSPAQHDGIGDGEYNQVLIVSLASGIVIGQLVGTLAVANTPVIKFISPSLLINQNIVYPPTLPVIPPLLTGGNVFHAPSLTSIVGLLPGLVTNTNTIYGPVLGNNILAPLVDNQQSFFSPTVQTPTWGALVKKSADDTADYRGGGGGVIVSWNQDVYDLGDWHSETVDNTKFFVPAGVSRVRLGGQVGFTGGTVQIDPSISFVSSAIGSFSPKVAWRIEATSGVTQAWSPEFGVAAGDALQMNFYYPVDTSITVVAAETWFAVENMS